MSQAKMTFWYMSNAIITSLATATAFARLDFFCNKAKKTEPAKNCKLCTNYFYDFLSADISNISSAQRRVDCLCDTMTTVFSLAASLTDFRITLSLSASRLLVGSSSSRNGESYSTAQIIPIWHHSDSQLKSTCKNTYFFA